MGWRGYATRCYAWPARFGDKVQRHAECAGVDALAREIAAVCRRPVGGSEQMRRFALAVVPHDQL
jgi:hypothetical protein